MPSIAIKRVAACRPTTATKKHTELKPETLPKLRKSLHFATIDCHDSLQLPPVVATLLLLALVSGFCLLIDQAPNWGESARGPIEGVARVYMHD